MSYSFVSLHPVTLIGLLGVVVDESLDADLYELDFGEDLVGGGGPLERTGVGFQVVM